MSGALTRNMLEIDSVWHMTQTQSGVWIEEIDLQKKCSVRPSMLMGSCDVYDPPLSESTLNLPQGTMSGALTRNMLENRLCVTQDTDTEWGTDRNRSREKVFGQT